MSTDRLTRQELSWLLAQEARSAAHLLRKGVSNLKIEEAPAISEVSTTLDALDDAVKTLATLQSGGAPHSRRGRIDVAALLLELAPLASINLEAGGTEIFADEADLRRMLQVLLSLGGSGERGSSIEVRREGDLIRVGVALGPDSSGASSMEQAWLHRMAVRHGGNLALEGNTVTLVLPAEVEKREVEELRRELAAAQEQGEMYAREIAAMFSQKPAEAPSKSSSGPTLAALSGALVAMFRPEISAIHDDSSGDLHQRTHHLLGSLDLLDRFARATFEAGSADLGRCLQDAADALSLRAERRGVSLSVSAPSHQIKVNHGVASLLTSLLLSQAVESSASGGQVKASLEPTGKALRLQIDDAGAAVPQGSRASLLSLAGDASSLGRPQGLHLGLASSAAERLGVPLILDDSPLGGLRVVVEFPR